MMSWRLLRCLKPPGLLEFSFKQSRAWHTRAVGVNWQAARGAACHRTLQATQAWQPNCYSSPFCRSKPGLPQAPRPLPLLRAHHSASPEMVQVEEQLTAIAKNIKFVDPIANLPREPTDEELSALQERLGHSFANRWLLRLALIHSSAAPETDNSSLAWLGDAAMGLVATEQLLAGLGVGTPLGRLAQERERLVSRMECVRRARRLGLEHLIVVGQCLPRAEISRNMLAELFEAVVGAVFVDGGLPAVRTMYRNMLEGEVIEEEEVESEPATDEAADAGPG